MRATALLAVLVACSAVPTARDVPPLPPTDVALAQLQAIRRPAASIAAFASLAAAAPAPRAAETLTSGQLSLTVSGHLSVQRTADDSFLVQVPASGAVVTAITSSVGPAGWAWNVPGPNNTALISQTSALPRPVAPCDAVAIVSGAAGGGSTRPVLGFATQNTSPVVDEAMAVVFVPYDVDETRVGKLLRAPAWGRRGPLVDFLRGFPFPVAWIDWTKLPSKALDGPTPTIDFCWRQHRYFSGDLYSEWAPHIHGVPPSAHQGYGTFVLGQMGQAMLMACSDAPLEAKKPLVLAILQRAIDDLGGLCDGSWRYSLGGHCVGRRGPLVMLGHLYNIDIFADPTPIVGNRLPEDQYQTVTAWWGAPWTGYVYSWQARQDLWTRAPSTWGDRNDPTHAAEAWQVCYGGQVVPAMLATAAAIVMMGREASAPKLVALSRCWFNGPPPDARAQLAAAGIDLQFGTDYAVEAGFAVRAWRRYGN